MNFVIKLLGTAFFLYEIKEFYSYGGLSNPIGFSLFKMILISLLPHVLPENYTSLIKQLKAYLDYLEKIKRLNVNSNYTGSDENFQLLPPMAYANNTRSRSKNRKNNFTRENYSD